VTLAALITRDGGTCVWCGRRPWADDLTAEHLLPRSRSGRGLPENLAVACRTCNKLRRTKPVAAYVRAQLEAGRRPRIDLLEAALERLSASASREHADYGRRQLDLMRRIADHPRPMSDHAAM
jgi:5-methylcytosine-specific restriction endonuclease McrA